VESILGVGEGSPGWLANGKLGAGRISAAIRQAVAVVARLSRAGFVRLLTPLASAALQDRYIRRATVEEYYVPDELLENAMVAAEFVRQQKGWVETLTPQQLDKALSFADAAQRFRGLDRLPESPAALLEHPAWVALRNAAADCLVALGYDLCELEHDPESQYLPPDQAPGGAEVRLPSSRPVELPHRSKSSRPITRFKAHDLTAKSPKSRSDHRDGDPAPRFSLPLSWFLVVGLLLLIGLSVRACSS
jgi:hypothetical protein